MAKKSSTKLKVHHGSAVKEQKEDTPPAEELEAVIPEEENEGKEEKPADRPSSMKKQAIILGALLLIAIIAVAAVVLTSDSASPETSDLEPVPIDTATPGTDDEWTLFIAAMNARDEATLAEHTSPSVQQTWKMLGVDFTDLDSTFETYGLDIIRCDIVAKEQAENMIAIDCVPVFFLLDGSSVERVTFHHKVHSSEDGSWMIDMDWEKQSAVMNDIMPLDASSAPMPSTPEVPLEEPPEEPPEGDTPPTNTTTTTTTGGGGGGGGGDTTPTEPTPEPEPEPDPEPEPTVPRPGDEGYCEFVNAFGNAENASGPTGPESGNDGDRSFGSLTIGPDDPDIIIFGTEYNGLVRSRDGGQTWERLRYGIRHDNGRYGEIYDLSISASHPNVMYIAVVGGLWPMDDNLSTSGVYKSTDYGDTWERKTCGIANGSIGSVHVLSDDPDTVLVSDAGGTTSGWSADIPAGTFFEGGLYRTTDGAETWTTAIEGGRSGGYVYTKAQEIGGPDFLLAHTVDTGKDGTEPLLWICSTDRGATWESCMLHLRDLPAGMAFSSDAQTIYRSVADEYTMYHSTDGGHTWDSTFIRFHAEIIKVSPTDSNRVLFHMISWEEPREGGLYLSTDGMQTFSQVIDWTDSFFEDIEFAPSNPNIVYAMTNHFHVFKSTDGGETWTYLVDGRNDVLNAIP